MHKFNKKGQVGIFIIGLVLIIIAIYVIVFSFHKILSENRYVGDETTLKVYDLKKCGIKHIPKGDRINFKSLDEALNKGYILMRC